MRERDIEARIVRAAQKLGCISIKLGQEGWPDRLFITPQGVHLYVEVKTPGRKPSKLQERRLSTLIGQRCHAIWSDCSVQAITWIRGFLSKER